MSKKRRVKLETLIVFLAIIIWEHHIMPPEGFRWSDLLNPFRPKFDAALVELVGESFIPLIVATIYYYIRKPTAEENPPNA
jgi:hypothetical protein